MDLFLLNLQRRLRRAIKQFWRTRGLQANRQGGDVGDKDRGDRSAVTGGRHLDGFGELVAALLEEAGLQRATIYWRKKTELPGWYRAEKSWDLLVVADKRLVAIVEFKSHVGSFGNNFNNRVEESLGNAVDLWAAYEEGAFRPSDRPWLGYFMLLEDSPKSTANVRVREPHFEVFSEFKASSYAERYTQLLTKLVRSRLYDSACLILSPRTAANSGNYREISSELTFQNFVASLLARVIAVAKTQSPLPRAEPKVEVGNESPVDES